MGRTEKSSKQGDRKPALKPVCIAGMHRSGTSMVTQLLSQCGLYLGRQEDILGPKSDNPDGFWENLHFVKLNDELLFRMGGAWDLPPKLEEGWERRPEITRVADVAGKLVSAFQGNEPWGWKDPRNSLLSPFWEDVIGRGQIRYIICLRNPLEVARSIMKRSGNSFAFSFNLWLTYNRTLMSDTRPEQRIITHYDAFFADPRAELVRLLDFLGMEVRSDLIVEACSKISQRLRHHVVTGDDLLKAGASAELIRLYEEMIAQAGPLNERSGVTAASPVDREREGSDIRGSSWTGLRAAPGKKDLTSIVILTFNQLKYTKECVESIRQFTPEPHEIIFVDNGSTDGTVKWLREMVGKDNRYSLIENGANLGFARGCNQGIRASSGEYLLLLNNDVVVTEGWLSGMLDCLRRDPSAGIVGPMTNNISGTQRDIYAVYKDMTGMHAYAREFRERNRHRRITLRRIVGFCMLFSRTLVDRIGLLDESFGTGNFEDDDYCLRASLEGFRNMVAGDVFIHHYGSRTFIGNRIDYGSVMSGHKKVFNTKWSGIRSGTELGRKLLVASALENADELAQKGEIDRAVERLVDGIRNVPENREIYIAMSEVLFGAKRFQDALDALASMPEEARDDPRAIILKGGCREGLEEYDEAEAAADSIIKEEPDHPAALNLKGVIAFRRGDKETAALFFERSASADQGYGEPLTNLGVIRWGGGDREAGLGLLERGFILSPKSMDAANLYHAAASEIRAYERAERIFGEARALYPLNQRVSFLLIDILLQQEKNVAAMSAIEEAMTVFSVDEGLLSAALAVRDKVGPKAVTKGKKKGTLSVSMIVKNEEEHMAKCLMSVVPVADEMVVVDTGSTDRTKEIAKALGARVFEMEWTGDFAEARNFSLSKAEGEWILSLDADEVISARDYTALREIVNKGRPAAYKIVTRNYSNQVGAQGYTPNAGEYPLEEAGMGWFPSAKVRLFPNDRRIRFENPVHEFVEGTVAKAGLPVKNSDIPVHHYGRLNLEKVRAKGEAYYELGIKKLREKGITDLKALFELGVQAGELQKYREAAELFEKLVQTAPEYPLAMFNLGFAYMELGRYRDALEYSGRAYALDPAKKECAVNYANCELVAGDVLNSISLLEEVLKKMQDYPPALAVLASAYAVTGRMDEGVNIIEKLHSQRFDCANCLHEIAEGLSNMGRHRQAIALYELIVKAKQLREDTRQKIDRCYAAVSRTDGVI